jgi:hypothetical protein
MALVPRMTLAAAVAAAGLLCLTPAATAGPTRAAGGAFDDLHALRAVADRWTYANDAINVINSTQTGQLKAAQQSIRTGVVPLMRQTVRLAPRFTSLFGRTPVRTTFGRGLKRLELDAVIGDRKSAAAFLAELRRDPAHPITAAYHFAVRSERQRKTLARELTALVSAVPRAESAEVLAAFGRSLTP